LQWAARRANSPSDKVERSCNESMVSIRAASHGAHGAFEMCHGILAQHPAIEAFRGRSSAAKTCSARQRLEAFPHCVALDICRGDNDDFEECACGLRGQRLDVKNLSLVTHNGALAGMV